MELTKQQLQRFFKAVFHGGELLQRYRLRWINTMVNELIALTLLFVQIDAVASVSKLF
jgi:hypothetical protein